MFIVLGYFGNPLEYFQNPNYKNINTLLPPNYTILLGVGCWLSEGVSDSRFKKKIDINY